MPNSPVREVDDAVRAEDQNEPHTEEAVGHPDDHAQENEGERRLPLSPELAGGEQSEKA